MSRRLIRPRQKSLRGDSWQNSLTDLGTANDKTTATRHRRRRTVSLDQIQGLYDEDWLAARIVDSLPAAALRKPVEVDAAATAALERFQELNFTERYPKGVLQFALKMGRLEAGCTILLGVRGRDGQTEKEISETAELEWLDIVRREQLAVVERDADPNSATYGGATVYRITGDHARRGLSVHASRLLWCEGRETASGKDYSWISDLNLANGMPPWGSVLQPVYETISNYGMTWIAVSHLIQEASIPIFKMRGLIDMLTQQDQSVINARFSALNLSRSVAKTVALDADGDESYERSGVSFADLPALVQQLLNSVSGAAEIPGTILFGYSPSGMNATGENDLRQWYDRVVEYQTLSVEPKMDRLLALCGAPNAEVTFAPLWEPSDAEKTETQNKQAQTDRIYWDVGAWSDEEIRRVRGEELGLTEAEAAKPLEVEPPPEPLAPPPPQVPPALPELVTPDGDSEDT